LRIAEGVAFSGHWTGQNEGLQHCRSAQEVCRGHMEIFLKDAQHQHLKLSEDGLISARFPSTNNAACALV